MKRIDKRRLTVDRTAKELIHRLIALGHGRSENEIVHKSCELLCVSVGVDIVRGAPPILADAGHCPKKSEV